MHPSLSRSQIPRYVQLADLFRQRIAKGHWASGEQLPSLLALVDEFDVARVTVRQAIDVLRREGLLSPEQGRGTFVTGRKAPDRWLRVRTTLGDLSEIYEGTSPELLNIAEGTSPPRLDAKEGTLAQKYFYMRRLHSQGGVPYAVIGIYLDNEIFRRSPKAFRRELVIPLLLKMSHVRIAKAHQTLMISTADVEVANLLAVPVNSPVAEVRRVFNAPDGHVLYLAEVTYRGDFIRMEMDLRP
jgi:GntR family transcriptional regulator